MNNETEENVSIENKNKWSFVKNKWVILGVCIVILVAGSGTGYYEWHLHEVAQVEAAYKSNLARTTENILLQSEAAGSICEKYSTDWNNAINISSYGDSVGDTNADSIVGDMINLDIEGYKADGTMKKLQSGKQMIDKEMQTLLNPSNTYKQAYSQLLQMYDFYTQLESEAESPQGSLVEFNQKMNQLLSDVTAKSNDLRISLPTNN